jgi:hypothetical protein
MENLMRFKTGVLAPRGFRRYMPWCSATAMLHVRRYGELFGALAAAPHSRANGLGVSPAKLTFGLLAFPAIWDWYLEWRHKHRGFMTSTETSLLYEAKSTTRDPTGWLRQHPELSRKITPISGLISVRDVQRVQKDWDAACDKTLDYACGRIFELSRITKPHRDPFATILPVLEADSPLLEYKKMADEILRRLPDHEDEVDLATAHRGYLMVRLAIHLGVRQRNLRELLLCPKGGNPRSMAQLSQLRRGEMRWNPLRKGWEVFIPHAAFKNSGSSFFNGRPFRILLPDLEGLYERIDEYLRCHRRVLLNGAIDPETVFVRDTRRSNGRAEYDTLSFYVAWKFVTRRYGVYNPYTRKGAIRGLLPHGPNCVRDILATHLLKQTGSYDLAAFAIQDAAVTVA